MLNGEVRKTCQEIDFCRNFRFFKENVTGIEPLNYDSISARIFKNIVSDCRGISWKALFGRLPPGKKNRNTGNLKAEQIQFIRTIITHFKINGIPELQQLAQPPFTEINDNGIFGLFEDDDQDRIIRLWRMLIVTRLDDFKATRN